MTLTSDLAVIHAVPHGTQAYSVHVLETGERAIVVTTPIRLHNVRWSWRFGFLRDSRNPDRGGGVESQL